MSFDKEEWEKKRKEEREKEKERHEYIETSIGQALDGKGLYECHFIRKCPSCGAIGSENFIIRDLKEGSGDLFGMGFLFSSQDELKLITCKNCFTARIFDTPSWIENIREKAKENEEG